MLCGQIWNQLERYNGTRMSVSIYFWNLTVKYPSENNIFLIRHPLLSKTKGPGSKN